MQVNTFLMMGRPGSGKGTQARLLAKKLGAEIYSSGNRLREMAKAPGFVNEKVRQTMDRGELLPAWFSSHLFIEVLLNLSPEDQIVFEGACRLEREAHDFDEVALWLERPYRVVYLQISEAEVRERLRKRQNIEGRADDASDIFDERMAEYKQNTANAVEYFRAKGRLVEVNGEQPIERVHADALEALSLS